MVVKEQVARGVNGIGVVEWHCHVASTSAKSRAMWDDVGVVEALTDDGYCCTNFMMSGAIVDQ